MGPIERELRGNSPNFGDSSVSYNPPLSLTACDVLYGAAQNMGIGSPSSEFVRHARDIFSEAIEAASELKL